MAATAFAAVVSLQHLIDNITQQQKHGPFHLKSLAENPLIEALRKRAAFLQDFLEGGYNYSKSGSGGDGDDDQEDINVARSELESRISDAAYAAEGILESHIVDRIQQVYESREHGAATKRLFAENLQDSSIEHAANYAGEVDGTLARGSCSSHDRENRPINHLDQSIEKVIRDMDLIIEEEVKKTKIKLEKMKANKYVSDDEQPTASFDLPASSTATPSRHSRGKNETAAHMVGFDEYLKQVLEMVRGQGSGRQVIPIFGMGGIGKTTLAQNVYEYPLVKQYFDRRAWTNISQEYSVRDILSGLLRGVGSPQERGEDHELGVMLHKELCGRRYLIVLDDMWSVEAWNKVSSYFPDNSNGSRIVITTRMSTLASHFGSDGLKVNLLDEKSSWNLFCRKVFGGEGCPDDLELVELEKKITKKCRGLPLSIVTIGGLLAKSEKTLVYWRYVLENLNSIVTSDDNEYCLNVLYLSYGHLPVHLKPCFLYMGVFPEDFEISVPNLIELWVAEGFLKPDKAKTLEEVGEECFHELIGRNLISAKDWGRRGQITTCTIHDLLREFCVKQAQKEKFLFVNVTDQDTKKLRRLAIHGVLERHGIHTLQSVLLLRSVTWRSEFLQDMPFQNNRLLRVINDISPYYIFLCLRRDIQFFNSRYISWGISNVSPSINLFWNLQTVYIKGIYGNLIPLEILEMPQLRHLYVFPNGILTCSPSVCNRAHNRIVLGSLQTIQALLDFEITVEIARRIPNVKKLQVRCSTSRCCLPNLHLLQKLESLRLSLVRRAHSEEYRLQSFAFPLSLKELYLAAIRLPWESIVVIGALPHLEVLDLSNDAFYGDEWNAVEGQFHSLKFLDIQQSSSLKYWNADETCFPCLEHLHLREMYELEEIPSGIGDIPTLQLIHVDWCKPSVIDSAKSILEEQQSYGNDTLQLHLGYIF